MENHCPLCLNDSVFYTKDKLRSFYKCTNCKSIFSSRDSLLIALDEKNRYKKHNNDVNDGGYQNFVAPMVDSILNDFDKNHSGFDFGAGPGAIISELLEQNNYNISRYDPYFWDDKELLSKKYDYIACCEVVEHFYNPDKEFLQLKNMLKKDGKLYIKTSIFDENIDFKSWYYKNDITHVFFYTKESLEYIEQKYNFKTLQIKDRLIIFGK